MCGTWIPMKDIQTRDFNNSSQYEFLNYKRQNKS